MKALVIGATGIIGNHVVRALLDDGADVRAFSRGVTPSLNLEGLKVERFQGDARDESALSKAMKGMDLVFHTAAYYPQNPFGLKEHVQEGMKGICAVLNALSRSSARLVYTSSLTTIGMAAPGKLADESLPYRMIKNPPHPYFLIKHLMEEEVVKRARTGMPAVIVNPTGCFGPFELKPARLCLVPQIIRGKIPAYVEHDLNVVDVADVGRGHLLAGKKGKNGERYILGGQNVTAGWLIRKICEIGKVKGPQLKIPLTVALVTSWVSEGIGYCIHRPSPFSFLGLRFLQYGQHFDLLKARTELGFLAAGMDNCLLKSITWFKKIGYC